LQNKIGQNASNANEGEEWEGMSQYDWKTSQIEKGTLRFTDGGMPPEGDIIAPLNLGTSQGELEESEISSFLNQTFFNRTVIGKRKREKRVNS